MSDDKITFESFILFPFL